MKKAIKKITALIAAGALCLPLFACSSSTGSSKETTGKSSESYTADFFAMDTVMHITATGYNAKEAVLACEKRINELEQRLSATRENSAISELNRNRELSDREISSLITDAISYSQATGGAFDITIRPLLNAWGFASKENALHVPEKEELSQLMKLVDYSKINVDGEQITLGEGQSIDLGGIAKGYASDCVFHILREYDIESALIVLGGSIHGIGAKADGNLWRTGIQDPDSLDSYIGVLEISDTAIVTSGAYQRYFEEDGVVYHHIIDPSTGYPSESDLLSVTVVCTDATKADAYSTALFIMGSERALALQKEHGNEFDLVLYTKDGELIITEGLAEVFSSELEYTVAR